MVKPITFCIPTANNEKEYTLLLLKSLVNNTDIDKHEILFFIDSDNQDTYTSLMEEKEKRSNIKIYRNETGYAFGTQRNVSIMFDAAKNDIVCYLQSDMVVAKDLDKFICEDLIDENTILSFTRIEPPLHPPSPDKVVMDFGITPEEFEYNKFIDFSNDLISQNKAIMHDIHFAPFALNKNIWFELLKGFDTQFRCSREDSDFINRCRLNNIRLIQSWKTIVYHFTCVSSRGKDWFKMDIHGKYKNEVQQKADRQELLRFIRKWGKFGHDINYFYDVGLSIDLDIYANVDVLSSIEPFVSNLYLNDEMVVDHLLETTKFNSHYYSNLRFKYPKTHWDTISYKFNPTIFSNRIKFTSKFDIKNDISISCKYSELVDNWNNAIDLIQNIQDIIFVTGIGDYEYTPFIIKINHKNNNIDKLKSLNINFDDLLYNPKCKFI